jgi:hypothetical protein
MVLNNCFIVIDFRKLYQNTHSYVGNNGQKDIWLRDEHFGIDILKSETEYLLNYALHKHSLGINKLIRMINHEFHYMLPFLKFAVNLKVHSNTGDELGQI